MDLTSITSQFKLLGLIGSLTEALILTLLNGSQTAMLILNNPTILALQEPRTAKACSLFHKVICPPQNLETWMPNTIVPVP